MIDQELFEYLQSYLTERRRELLWEMAAQRTRHFTVVTEDVYQAHNTSAVLRSCEVFGIQEVHLVTGRFGKRMDREIAMGAQKWVDLHRYQSIDTCLSGLRKRGYQLVATVPHGKAIDLADFSIQQPAALLFGTEKEGLSEEVIAQCDSCLQIPMYGFTESLNISVAAAIILQDLSSRLRRSDVPWQLDDEAQRELVYAWTCNTIKSVDQIIERYTERKKR